MAESASNTASKKLIQIDVSSDSVCPWCFVGKKNLDKAIDASKDQYNFEVISSLSFILFTWRMIEILTVFISRKTNIDSMASLFP